MFVVDDDMMISNFEKVLWYSTYLSEGGRLLISEVDSDEYKTFDDLKLPIEASDGMLVNMIMNRGYLTKIRCYRSSSPFSSSTSFVSLRSSSPSSSSSVSVRPTAEIYYRYQSYYQFSTSVSDRSSEAKAVKSSSKVKEVLVYTGTTIDEYNNDNNNYSLVTYSIISTCAMIIIHYIFIYIFRIIFKEDEMVT